MVSIAIFNNCNSPFRVNDNSLGPTLSLSFTSPSQLKLEYNFLTLTLTFIYPSIFSDNVNSINVNIGIDGMTVTTITNSQVVSTNFLDWSTVYTGDNGNIINYNINVPE